MQQCMMTKAQSDKQNLALFFQSFPNCLKPNDACIPNSSVCEMTSCQESFCLSPIYCYMEIQKEQSLI